MKRANKLMILGSVMMFCFFFFFQGEVRAASPDFYKRYSVKGYEEEYTFKLKAKCKLTLTMECYGHDDSDDWEDDDDWDDWDEDWIDGFSVAILDEYDDDVFEHWMYKDGVYNKRLTLPAGTYYVMMEGDNKCSLTLSGDYIPVLSSSNLSLDIGKTKTLSVKGTTKKVTWKSEKPSIASVTSKGVVKGKKAGKTTITAKCNGYTLKCKVTVKKKQPTYTTLAKKMKAIAAKNKNFQFKNIDVGKKCKLFAKKELHIDKSKIESQGFFMVGTYQPYMELAKKGNRAELRLKIEGGLEMYSIYYTSLRCNKLNISSPNRRMNLYMENVSASNTYSYSTGLYHGISKGYVTVSTSSKKSDTNLKKLEAMTGQSSLKMRIESLDGWYFYSSFTSNTRKNWNKFVKDYQKLLKEY